jgi:uncharacterized membrane protein
MNILNLIAPEKIKWGNIEIIDYASFFELFGRFALNLIVILVLVRWLYYTTARRKDYLFTYILISCIVFLLCYLLASVKLQIGFALGLFAIFGIIRYRTDAMPIKEMTYLFLIIGVSVINALADTKSSVADIIFTNIAVIAVTYALEKSFLLKRESSKLIVYEKLNLIKSENYKELIKDLQERTGIQKIKRVEIGKIDLLKDTCLMTVYFEDPGNFIHVSGQKENNNTDTDDED